MRIASSSASLLLLAITSLALGACDRDARFENAPSAQAGGAQAQAPASPTARPQDPAGARAPARADIPARGQLPTDHPPIGAGIAPSDKAPRPQAPATADKINTYGKSGPVHWTAPKGWEGVRPSSSMRLAEYHAPGPAGKEPAVMSIFFFGPGGGGGVDANIDRWVGQFKQPDGSSSQAAAKRSVRESNGMKVHVIDVSGTYNAGAAMVQGAASNKAQQRVLGAIVEAPGGLVFFKLLGPAETVAAQSEAFDAFVASFKPAP